MSHLIKWPWSQGHLCIQATLTQLRSVGWRIRGSRAPSHTHLCPIRALTYLLNDVGVEWLVRMGDYLMHLLSLKKFLLSASCGLIVPPSKERG